jgi:hypothetical protein
LLMKLLMMNKQQRKERWPQRRDRPRRRRMHVDARQAAHPRCR